MTLARTGELTHEDFTVLDDAGELLPGIDVAEFTYELFDPNGSSTALTMTFSELGSGHYRVSWTPDAVGIWYLVVYHATYFPEGKAGNIQVQDNDFDTLADLINVIKDIEEGGWKLVGSEMIFYKADNATEVARFTIYTDVEGNPIQRDRQ